MSDRQDPPDTAPREPFLADFRPVQLDFLGTGVRINLPPQGFDPSKASDAELRAHFLPPRPSRRKSPRAYDRWYSVMSRRPIWPNLSADEQRVENLFVASRLLTHLQAATAPQAATEAASSNWSGIYARALDHSHVARVQGIWTVPQPEPLDTSPAEYASSMWVGLDGYDPASRSLPQVGTGQWVSVDRQRTIQRSIFAWWQWFVRDSPTNGQIIIKAIPVSANDRVYAQVTKIAPDVVSIFIMNLTTNMALPFWFSFVGPVQPSSSPTNPLQPHIEGMTASWILERPAQLGSTNLFTLPDYGNAAFEFCLAGTDTFGPSQDVDLRRANLLRMVEWNTTPTSAKIVSTSERNGDVGILLHYG